DAESGKPAFSLASLFTVTGRYLMKLTVIEAAGRLQCQLEYDEAGIPESEVRRVWDNLRALVESGVKSPDRRVELLDILSAEAKAQLIGYARGEAIGWEVETVHRMVERQAEERPDGVAIVYEGNHLSYEEFNRRGNQLGNYLK